LDQAGLGPTSDYDRLPMNGRDIWAYLHGAFGLSVATLTQISEEYKRYWSSFQAVNVEHPQSFPLLSYDEQLLKWLEANKGLRVKHDGGLLNDEGLFLGLSGEGVLNRTAMQSLGESGLNRLNEGENNTGGNRYEFYIQAWDGEDVERVLTEKIIPALAEKSEAGVEIIHERGIKTETLV